MAGRREEIRLGPEEIDELLSEQRIVIVTSLDPDGWPHSVPLWYVVRDSEPWIFTYAKSQKVRNLARDARATLLIETGDLYHEVKGVMYRARAEIHHDLDTVASVAEELFARYESNGAGGLDDETREVVRARASKRVAVQFHIERTVSWDHGKLGGRY